MSFPFVRSLLSLAVILIPLACPAAPAFEGSQAQGFGLDNRNDDAGPTQASPVERAVDQTTAPVAQPPVVSPSAPVTSQPGAPAAEQSGPAGATQPVVPPLRLKESKIWNEGVNGTIPGPNPPALFLRAERLTSATDQFMQAQGHAEAREQGLVLQADQIDYDPAAQTLEATGQVHLIRNDSLSVDSPHTYYEMQQHQGYIDNPTFSYHDDSGQIPWRARGKAQELYFTAADQERIIGSSFTTCPVGNDDWYLRTPRLDMNHTTDEGDAHDGSIDFMGKSILWAPDLTFPLDNQRRSGLLAPVIGTSVSTGQDVALPYYINLAPNIDDTLTPRFMSLRGIQLNNELRYLEPSMNGTLETDYLPHDTQTGNSRWFTSWIHHETLLPGLTFNANTQSVSDPNYMIDLNTMMGPQGLAYLPRDFNLTYTGLENWAFTAHSLDYQPLFGAVPTYRLEPQLTAHGFNPDWYGVSLDLASDYSSFISPGMFSGLGTVTVNGATYNSSYQSIVSGTRTHLYPSVALPLRSNAGFLTFKTGVDMTQYNLGQYNTLPMSQMTRTLPITSLDGGLYFDRESQFFGQDIEQTLEPRLYYLYIPYRNQDLLPVFDTGLADFNTSTIFSENQFAGIDRINNANALTAAVTSRILNPATGAEALSAMIGERYYFTPNNVLLPGQLQNNLATSNFLASLVASITQRWKLDSYFNIDTQTLHTQQMAATLTYSPAPAKLINLSYRIDTPLQGVPALVYNASGIPTTYVPGVTGPIPINDYTSVKQWDVSTEWPLTSRVSLLGRVAYSALDNQVIQSLTGVEYNAGCWALRAFTTRYAVSTIQANNTLGYTFFTSFYVQLELGSLGLGQNPYQTLRMNIPGYVKTNTETPP